MLVDFLMYWSLFSNETFDPFGAEREQKLFLKVAEKHMLAVKFLSFLIKIDNLFY